MLELCEDLLERVNTDFLEVMERNLRGETAEGQSDASQHVVDNSMALVLVPKHQVRARRNLAASMDDNEKPVIALAGDETDAKQDSTTTESQSAIPGSEDKSADSDEKCDIDGKAEEHSAVFSKTGVPSSSKAAKFLQLSTQSDTNNQSDAGHENNNQSEHKLADQSGVSQSSTNQSTVKHPGARQEGRKSNAASK